MKKLLPCPFCGQPIAAVYPNISDHGDGTWSVTHFCFTEDRNPGKDLEVCLVSYGKTEDEAIARWNRRVTQNV